MVSFRGETPEKRDGGGTRKEEKKTLDVFPFGEKESKRNKNENIECISVYSSEAELRKRENGAEPGKRKRKQERKH